MKLENTNNYQAIKEFYPDKVVCGISTALNNKGEEISINYTINNNFLDTIKDLSYDGYSSVQILISGAGFFQDKAYFLISNLINN